MTWYWILLSIVGYLAIGIAASIPVSIFAEFDDPVDSGFIAIMWPLIIPFVILISVWTLLGTIVQYVNNR